jgi:hypothetical protein
MHQAHPTHREHARPPGPSGGGTRPLLALLALVLLAVPALGFSEPPPVWSPVQPTETDILLRDLELTLRARKTLLQDPILAPLAIGVSVHDRVAVLWGKVPSVELAHQAQSRLRQVLGLTDVRDDLCVCPPAGADAGRPLPPVAQRAPLAEPAIPQPPRILGALVHRPGDELIAPGRDVLWRPGEGKPVGSSATEPISTPAQPPTPTWRPKTSPVVTPAPSTLPMPPGIIIMPFTTSAVAPALPLPGLVTEQPLSNLAEAIEALRRRESRFQRVEYAVQDGVVRVRAAPGHSDDLFAFAQAVSRLSGVQRVVLEDSRPTPRR